MSPASRSISWDDFPEGQRLGQVADKVLAALLRCSRWSVCRARMARNIPAWGLRDRVPATCTPGGWPSDAELKRQNESAGEQSLRDAGLRGGLGQSVAGDCADRGSDLRR